MRPSTRACDKRTREVSFGGNAAKQSVDPRLLIADGGVACFAHILCCICVALLCADMMLSTIVDEEQHLHSPAATGLSSHLSTVQSHQRTPEDPSSALSSPLQGGAGGAPDGTSPQFPKKLVFSPDSASAASSAVSPPAHSHSLHRAVPLSAASAASSVRSRDSLSPPFTRPPSQHQQQQHASVASSSSSTGGRARFVSPPPAASGATPPAAHTSYSSSRFMSPATLAASDGDEGLLGQDEVGTQAK